MKKIVGVLMLLILPLIALADQAAYVTKEQAQKAAALLKNQKQIKHYCAPCEDKSVRTEDLQEVEAGAAGYENYWEVKINGEGVDLAYIYFQTKDGKWKNVAIELDIEVEDVPKILPAEKE